MLTRLKLPTTMLPEVVEPGSVLGQLLPSLQTELGAAQVIAPATHDTGSAIAAVPVSTPGGWGYISSGTWSLVGVELANPLLSAEADRQQHITYTMPDCGTFHSRYIKSDWHGQFEESNGNDE